VDVVDLRSDTVTRPTAGMREAMAAAEVGDDVLGDDPTTNRFQERMAELLGVEDALFFPSGIQANQTALGVLGRPATEVVCEASAHIVDWEDGAASALSGLQLSRVVTKDGVLTPDAVRAHIRDDSPYQPDTSVLALENTHLASGGRVMTPEATAELCAVAREHGLSVHLDGARLWNAAVAGERPVADYTAGVDTVMVSLSKGLGAPVGSALGGDGETIERARRLRRRLGGAMRQTGVLTAAADWALDHNLPRLGDDHRRARALWKGLDGTEGLAAVEPETNIVFIDVEPGLATADHVLLEARTRGVLLSRFTAQRLRAVTHMDIDDEGIARAVAALALDPTDPG